MSIEYFGVNSTYSPFSDSMSLRTVTNEKFGIPRDATFLSKPVIGVATGLIPTNSSFLDESFKVIIEEPNGNELIKLKKVLGKVGNDTYPSEYEVMWFDSENMQSVFWIHEKWESKVLSVTGDFVTTTLTSEVSALYLTGLIMACGFNVIEGLNDLPPNSLICDGSAVSRTRYNKLFSKIGTTWGDGDGSKTFNLPDGRSGTLKGIGSGVLDDPDRVNRLSLNGSENGDKVGSYQRFATKTSNSPHNHPYTDTYIDGSRRNRGNISSDCASKHHVTAHKTTSSTYVNLSTGNSTRDNNLGINWIIFT